MQASISRAGSCSPQSGSATQCLILNTMIAGIQIPRWKMYAMFFSMIAFLFGTTYICEGGYGIPKLVYFSLQRVPILTSERLCVVIGYLPQAG